MTASVSRISTRRVRTASVLIFFVTWQLGSMLADPTVLPGPWRVILSINDHITNGELLYHIGVTLTRVIISFLIAMAAGTALGLTMGRKKQWNAALDWLLILTLNIPALVVIILCYLWFGLGESAVILAVVINKFPIVVVNMREGARAIDKDLLQVADAFRLDWRRTFFRVYLPQLYPYLLASARSGLALVWKIVLVAELLGRSNGVGFKLSVFFNYFDITSILAYSLAFISVILVIEYLVIGPLDRYLTGWRS